MQRTLSGRASSGRFQGAKNNGKLLNREAKRWSRSFIRDSRFREPLFIGL